MWWFPRKLKKQIKTSPQEAGPKATHQHGTCTSAPLPGCFLRLQLTRSAHTPVAAVVPVGAQEPALLTASHTAFGQLCVHKEQGQAELRAKHVPL